jgi:hypothetical protein
MRSEKWKIRSVEMENLLGKNEKSTRLKWKMHSLKLVKSALLNKNLRSVKLKNSLSKSI